MFNILIELRRGWYHVRIPEEEKGQSDELTKPWSLGYKRDTAQGHGPKRTTQTQEVKSPGGEKYQFATAPRYMEPLSEKWTYGDTLSTVPASPGISPDPEEGNVSESENDEDSY